MELFFRFSTTKKKFFLVTDPSNLKKSLIFQGLSRISNRFGNIWTFIELEVHKKRREAGRKIVDKEHPKKQDQDLLYHNRKTMENSPPKIFLRAILCYFHPKFFPAVLYRVFLVFDRYASPKVTFSFQVVNISKNYLNPLQIFKIHRVFFKL